ncbi:MAG: alpha/beta hydrolase [Cyanobacteria bacterium]|nr:alpha/beta hydrolase [Cyanobacteriota bacterium]
MHGWAGDAQVWEPFHHTWSAHGWAWQCGERGYSGQAPRSVDWQNDQGLKLVIAHSLGPHLLPDAVLAQADAVVLLASFGMFVPGGAGGGRLRSAIAAMTSQLSGPEASTMLETFMERAAAPQSTSLLPPGIAAFPLDASGRQRLAQDLKLLAATAGLPPCFPLQARVLIVEGGEDQILNPQARHQLRCLLPAADTLVLAGVGHCLLSPALVPTVCGWIEGLS